MADRHEYDEDYPAENKEKREDSDPDAENMESCGNKNVEKADERNVDECDDSHGNNVRKEFAFDFSGCLHGKSHCRNKVADYITDAHGGDKTHEKAFERKAFAHDLGNGGKTDSEKEVEGKVDDFSVILFFKHGLHSPFLMLYFLLISWYNTV